MKKTYKQQVIDLKKELRVRGEVRAFKQYLEHFVAFWGCAHLYDSDIVFLYSKFREAKDNPKTSEDNKSTEDQ